MCIVRNLFFVLFVVYNSVFVVDLEIEIKNDKKSGKKFYKFYKNYGLEIEFKNDKKFYDFIKNSVLEGIDLEKSFNFKSYKKSDKKFYK